MAWCGNFLESRDVELVLLGVRIVAGGLVGEALGGSDVSEAPLGSSRRAFGYWSFVVACQLDLDALEFHGGGYGIVEEVGVPFEHVAFESDQGQKSSTSCRSRGSYGRGWSDCGVACIGRRRIERLHSRVGPGCAVVLLALR